jgi:hypothetical protein
VNGTSLIVPSSVAVVGPSVAVAEKWVPPGADIQWSKLPHEKAATGLAVVVAAATETVPSSPRRHSPATAMVMTRLPNRIIDDAPSGETPGAPGARGRQAEDTDGHANRHQG